MLAGANEFLQPPARRGVHAAIGGMLVKACLQPPRVEGSTRCYQHRAKLHCFNPRASRGPPVAGRTFGRSATSTPARRGANSGGSKNTCGLILPPPRVAGSTRIASERLGRLPFKPHEMRGGQLSSIASSPVHASTPARRGVHTHALAWTGASCLQPPRVAGSTQPMQPSWPRRTFKPRGWRGPHTEQQITRKVYPSTPARRGVHRGSDALRARKVLQPPRRGVHEMDRENWLKRCLQPPRVAGSTAS